MLSCVPGTPKAKYCRFQNCSLRDYSTASSIKMFKHYIRSLTSMDLNDFHISSLTQMHYFSTEVELTQVACFLGCANKWFWQELKFFLFWTDSLDKVAKMLQETSTVRVFMSLKRVYNELKSGILKIAQDSILVNEFWLWALHLPWE